MATHRHALSLVPNAPGFTPLHVRPISSTALGAGTTGGPDAVAAAAPPAPTAWRLAYGRLEDAALVLLLVLAVPVVIMLLALPIVLVFRFGALLGGAR